jgi:transcriptional regulator with XRE-family HTH domain
MNGNRLKNETYENPVAAKRGRPRFDVVTRQESAAAGMDDYNIGSQLKTLRKARNLTLQFVAVETGMSAALLSQIENGNVTPSLKTLSKLASYYQIRLGKLFDRIKDEPRYEIFRRTDRGHDNPYGNLVQRKQDYCFPLQPFGPKKKMACSLFELHEDVGYAASSSRHGETFLHVVAGKVEIRSDEEVYALEAGDSLYLDSSLAIAMRPVRCSRATIIRVETA